MNMKHLFFMLCVSFSIFALTERIDKTVYQCCAPNGICDEQTYPNMGTCTNNCNDGRCESKRIIGEQEKVNRILVLDTGNMDIPTNVQALGLQDTGYAVASLRGIQNQPS